MLFSFTNLICETYSFKVSVKTLVFIWVCLAVQKGFRNPYFRDLYNLYDFIFQIMLEDDEIMRVIPENPMLRSIHNT